MKKINLAIRGGGVKVPAIGVMKAFEENGIEISSYSGTSIGAVLATLGALETPADEILDLVKKFVTEYSNANRLKGGSGSYIIERTVNEYCGNMKFEELKKDLYIVANAGGLWYPKVFIFSKKDTPKITLGEACRASSSFPIAYERYKLKVEDYTYRFWDGGMALNPYVPNEFTILSTFQKSKVNLKSRYKSAWLIPEEQADFLIKPYIGKVGSFGTPEDIEMTATLGYYETKKRMEELIRTL